MALVMLLTLGLAACQSTSSASYVVPVGTPRVLDRLLSINEDCTSLGEAVARLTQAPQHGSVEFKRTSDYPNFLPANPRSVCNKQKVPTTQVVYTPEGSYAGIDNFVVDVIFPNGASRQTTYPISIR